MILPMSVDDCNIRMSAANAKNIFYIILQEARTASYNRMHGAKDAPFIRSKRLASDKLYCENLALHVYYC